ncbi:hypothetical protein, partial [Caulobacter sp. CCH5-E12]|uniref:hypothetical protein n=1 Tax=Caulobacter sp. CCH5-E12 TaxID=1768770 RepID=UPI001E570332
AVDREPIVVVDPEPVPLRRTSTNFIVEKGGSSGPPFCRSDALVNIDSVLERLYQNRTHIIDSHLRAMRITLENILFIF